jgi:phosphatidylglycerol---prolipoprotein diacylglyceryl transferase
VRPTIVAWLKARIGVGFFVPTYDLLLAAAVVAVFYIALRESERRQLDSDRVFRAGLVMALVGFGAARLYVVLQYPDLYLRDPLDAFRVWKGGTASTGMYLGVLVAAVATARWQRLPIRKLLDSAAPSAAAGIVVGRLACFVNGCCFGTVSDLPWAVRFPAGSGPQVAQLTAGLVGPGQTSEPVHPVQLYEAAFAALLFLFLWRHRRVQQRDGELAALFLLLYGLARFGTEFLRGDPRAHLGPLSVPQIFWLMAVACSATFLMRNAVRRASVS